MERRQHFFVPSKDARDDGGDADDDLQSRPLIVALAADMAAHGTARDAPVRNVMGLLGDRWSTLVLLVLTSGPCRHAALRRLLSSLSSEGDVSQRVLTLKLRALERDGFVVRSVSEDVPPRVSYALSALGQDLAAQARGMIDWVNSNEKTIHTARREYDAREEE